MRLGRLESTDLTGPRRLSDYSCSRLQSWVCITSFRSRNALNLRQNHSVLALSSLHPLSSLLPIPCVLIDRHISSESIANNLHSKASTSLTLIQFSTFTVTSRNDVFVRHICVNFPERYNVASAVHLHAFRRCPRSPSNQLINNENTASTRPAVCKRPKSTDAQATRTKAK